MSGTVHELTTPVTEEDILKIRAGDVVYITGTILTARDEAHDRIIRYDREGKELPFDLDGAVIYHCGPVMQETEEASGKNTDASGKSATGKTGWKAVAAGPTTSDRMTKMTPEVLKNHRIRVLIGKGGMQGIAPVLREKCIYLSYTGGCAALAVSMIGKVDGVFWEDLGMPEAVWILKAERFGPLIAGVDSYGKDLFEEVREGAEEAFLKI